MNCGDKMSRKYLIIGLAIALFISVSLSPVIAVGDTYSVNVGGIDLNMPNNYKVNEDFIFEEDVNSQDRWGNSVPVHYKSIDYTDGNNTITIRVTTSYGEAFTLENAGFADGPKKTIANKTGVLNGSPGDVLFSYVENGKIVQIETFMENNNEDIIGKVIGN